MAEISVSALQYFIRTDSRGTLTERQLKNRIIKVDPWINNYDLTVWASKAEFGEVETFDILLLLPSTLSASQRRKILEKVVKLLEEVDTVRPGTTKYKL